MRGVIVFGVRDDVVQSARFYLEPVDDGDGDGRRRGARASGARMILVAGGTGRLGTRSWSGASPRSGAEVRVLTRDVTRAEHLEADARRSCVGDVRETASIDAAIEGVTTVVSAVQGFAGLVMSRPESVDHVGNAHLVDSRRGASAPTWSCSPWWAPRPTARWSSSEPSTRRSNICGPAMSSGRSCARRRSSNSGRRSWRRPSCSDGREPDQLRVGRRRRRRGRASRH